MRVLIYIVLMKSLILASFGLSAESNKGIDDVYYADKPVNMIISEKKDSLIYFPNAVKLKDGNESFADVLMTKDVVIVKALRIFEKRRFIFQDMTTDKIYIFNISANRSTSPRHVRLLLPILEESPDYVRSKGSSYVSLTRHAAMSLYYPDRYMPTTKGVRKLKVKKGDASFFVSFNADTEVVGSWKGFGFFVTAVKVTNLESNEIVLDPRTSFRGNWLFLTPQHSWLSPAGNDQNNITTIYVISKRPFWESLI